MGQLSQETGQRTSVQIPILALRASWSGIHKHLWDFCYPRTPLELPYTLCHLPCMNFRVRGQCSVILGLTISLRRPWRFQLVFTDGEVVAWPWSLCSHQRPLLFPRCICVEPEVEFIPEPSESKELSKEELLHWAPRSPCFPLTSIITSVLLPRIVLCIQDPL